MQLSGIWIPLVTPFAPDGAVATEALARLAHDVLAAGAAGVVALGTTGETATLSAGERDAVIGACARVCRERGAGLIVGAGSNDTEGSARALGELGGWPEVSAALVVVPYYTRPAEDGVVAHFGRLAGASPVPLLVYHIPYRTGQALSAATLRRLAALEGVAGVKYAVGGIDADTVALLADRPSGFAVLAGDDLYASPMLALGAEGAILASAHIATDRFVALADSWRAGDAGYARRLGHRLAGLSAELFAEPNPAVVKAVLHAQGRIPTPDVRLPLLPASPSATERALACASCR